MATRPTTDPYNNPSGLIDRRFGDMYRVVENLSDNIILLKHISNYMKELFEIHKHIDALRAVGENTDTLNFIKTNLSSLTAYFAANDALIAGKATLTAQNRFTDFTALGNNAPLIKQKLITFQTGSIGSTVVVPHLLNLSNIVDYSTVVSTSDNLLTKPDKDIYTVTVGATDITLKVSDTSTLAVDRRCKMLFTHIPTAV